jgi:hypothetical protein
MKFYSPNLYALPNILTQNVTQNVVCLVEVTVLSFVFAYLKASFALQVCT